MMSKPQRRKPVLIDLFCCAGGASVGYHRAGFDVFGVDISPQPNYPFPFWRGDVFEAMRLLADGGRVAFTRGDETFHLGAGDVDAYAASPPCQAHSTLTKGNVARGIGLGHVDLVGETRRALQATGRPYVIENVQSAPVREDVKLCGLMFNLRVFRHRIFEAGGVRLEAPEHPSHRGHRVAGWRHGVKHEGDMVAVYGNGGGKGSVAEWQEAMGIHHTSSKSELSEAIPPAYTEHIGKQLIEHINDTR